MLGCLSDEKYLKYRKDIVFYDFYWQKRQRFSAFSVGDLGKNSEFSEQLIKVQVGFSPISQEIYVFFIPIMSFSRSKYIANEEICNWNRASQVRFDLTSPEFTRSPPKEPGWQESSTIMTMLTTMINKMGQKANGIRTSWVLFSRLLCLNIVLQPH
jgi:hypothetical protein